MVNMIVSLKFDTTILTTPILHVPKIFYVRFIEVAISILFSSTITLYNSAASLFIALKPISVAPINLVIVGCTILLLAFQQAQFTQSRNRRHIGTRRDRLFIKFRERLNLLANRTFFEAIRAKLFTFNSSGVAFFSSAFFALRASAIRMPGMAMECIKGKKAFTTSTMLHHNTSASISAYRMAGEARADTGFRAVALSPLPL